MIQKPDRYAMAMFELRVARGHHRKADSTTKGRAEDRRESAFCQDTSICECDVDSGHSELLIIYLLPRCHFRAINTAKPWMQPRSVVPGASEKNALPQERIELSSISLVLVAVRVESVDRVQGA